MGIWGSIADWVMIVVTSVTAYFLFKTLKSQKEVQETQNELLKIEQLRIREHFKPILQYSKYEDGMQLKEDGKIFISIQIVNTSENPALNIKPIYPDKFATAVSYKPNPFELIKDKEPMSLHFVVEHLSKKSVGYYHFGFAVEYDDIAGTRYKQGIFCRNYYQLGEEIMVFMPEVIPNKS